MQITNEKNKILKDNKAITLIALVITIIILLILAGISISALTQTGLFGKAKKAEQKSKAAQELENTTLGDYENNIDLYLSGISRDNGINGSKVFSNISFKLEQNGGKIKVTISPSFVSGKSSQDVYEYIIVVNGKAYATTKEVEANINNIKALTDYEVSVIGIDMDTGIIRSEASKIKTSELTFVEKLLDYPVITLSGVNNVIYECDQDAQYNYYDFDASKGKTTATDSLPFECYDRDESTFEQITTYNSDYKIKLSEEFKEKSGKLKIKANLISGSDSGVFMQFDNTKDNLGIGNYQYWYSLLGNGNYYISTKEILTKCQYLGFSRIGSEYSGYNLYEIYPYITE